MCYTEKRWDEDRLVNPSRRWIMCEVKKTSSELSLINGWIVIYKVDQIYVLVNIVFRFIKVNK